MNPFIQRMVGDMQLRNLADGTIDAHTYHVDKFCRFFGKPADQLRPEEIREYWKLTRPRNHLFPDGTPDVPLSSATDRSAPSSSEPSPFSCARCGAPLRCLDRRRRPSWKYIFTRSIYVDAALYSPAHHIHSRAPPPLPLDE